MGRTACTEPQCLYKGALYLFNFRLMEEQKTQLTPTITDSGRTKFRRTLPKERGIMCVVTEAF